MLVIACFFIFNTPPLLYTGDLSKKDADLKYPGWVSD